MTQEKWALVDEADYELLSKKTWCYDNGSGYAVSGGPRGAGLVYMHKLLVPEGGPEVDHRDGNKLNNRRDNLRPATHLQNASNRGKLPSNTSGYCGVYWDKRMSRWFAQLKHAGIQYYLGSCDTPEEAARLYDEAALRYRGEFARLNFPKA